MSQMDVEGEITPEIIENRQYSIPSILFVFEYNQYSLSEYSCMATTKWNASK